MGDKLDVSIEPEEGYGLRMQDAIQEIPSSALQGVDEVKVGMQLQSQDKDGNAFLVSVTKIEDDKNHCRRESSIGRPDPSLFSQHRIYQKG